MKSFLRWRKERSIQPGAGREKGYDDKRTEVMSIAAQRSTDPKISRSASSSMLLNVSNNQSSLLQRRQSASTGRPTTRNAEQDTSTTPQFFSPSRIRFDSIVTGTGEDSNPGSRAAEAQNASKADRSKDLDPTSRKTGKAVAAEQSPAAVIGRSNGQKSASSNQRNNHAGPSSTMPPPAVPLAEGRSASHANGELKAAEFVRRPSATSQQSSTLSGINLGLRPAMLVIDPSSPSPSATSSTFDKDSRTAPARPDRRLEPSHSMDLSHKSSAMSLKSKGRLSGMMGMWKKSPSSTSFDQRSPSTNDLGSIPSPPTSQSQMLANELNELAVAFDEGLLGEEEYRMLRKGVFDKMMTQGGMEIPKESTLRASQTSPADLTHVQGDDTQSNMTSSRSKLSRRSTNLRSLFRSNSQSSHAPSAAKLPQPSDRSGYSSTSRFGQRSTAAEQAVLQEQYSEARRARTLRGVSSMNALESASLFGQGGNGNHSSARSAVTNFSVGGISVSKANGLLGHTYGEKSSAQIAAEMAVVEAEKKRMLENFKTLEVQAIGRHSLTFEQIRSAALFAEREAKKVTRSGASDGGGDGGHHANGHGAGTQRVGTKLLNGSPYPPSSAKRAEIVRRTSAKDSETTYDNSDGSGGESALRVELVAVLKKRAEVSAKYDDRLAFLRSAMRSAKIREGLR